MGDENTCRKDFAPSEAVAVGVQLEKLERPKAKERQAAAGPKKGRGRKRTGSGNLPEPVKGDTRDSVATAVGMKRSTYAKAKEVIDAAAAEPEKKPERRCPAEGAAARYDMGVTVSRNCY